MKHLSSLRVRLVLWTVALEAVLLLIFAGMVVVVLENLQHRQFDEALRLSAAQLSAVIDLSNGQFTIEPADIVPLRREGILAWLLTPAGKVVKTVGDAANLPAPSVLPNFNILTNASLPDGRAARLLVVPFQAENSNLGPLVLVLALPLHNNQVFLQMILLSLGIAIPVVLLLSAAGGLFLAGQALAPVSAITEMSRRINAAELDQRLQLDLPNDEIGQLAQTFNAMLDRLHRAFEHERRLTADVSHELRTPLAMLKTQLSLARSRPRCTCLAPNDGGDGGRRR